MQPGATDSAHGVTLVKGEGAGLGVPVNDQRFWSRKEEDVPVDQRFFHAYFTRKAEKEREKAKKVGRRKGHADESDEDADAPDDDEAEAEELVSASEDGEEASASEGEEEEEAGSGDESDDGGFDLPTKGQKPAPVEDDEDEENSDAEEAEIWKVRDRLSVCIDMFLTRFTGDESNDARRPRRRRPHAGQRRGR